ncbi:MAG: WG repeat-containing protein [Bacteroides sp.]|nr:WG repeat-containing protein [Bacteroides sp.]MBD5349881.1 WG repeat-containing protein [Bacteroides sp.]
METKNIKELGKQEFSNVRILVDLPEYDIEKDTRLLIPFSYYQHYGLMNRNGDVVVEPKYDRILDSCYNESDVVRVAQYYTYGFNRSTKEPSTYLGTKWGLLDSSGNLMLDLNYKAIGVSDDKKILTLRHMDGQYEVITIDGEVIVPKGKYPWVDTYEKGVTRVNGFMGEDKRYGIIDMTGKFVLPLRYSNIWNFVNKNRTVTTIESIDEHGNKLVGNFNLITHEADI